MNFILGYLTVSIVFICILYLIAQKAPYGYQDETGFHFGVPFKK